ncbi:MAG: type VI secretion system baseplate subunit TssG [Chitinispirillaceae bacterium]|nr:type VI secretion system baseplate subunit TssG [Chitinispirillaceae bacterium]
MADTNGRTGSDIINSLPAQVYTFDFFRLIRRLESTVPGTSSIGGDAHPAQEVVHVRPDASFRFPPSAVTEIKTDKDGTLPLLITITFFGLYGRYGTLPWHYTSRVIHQERLSMADSHNPEGALRPFLDIFNHRFASFFYRSGIKYRWPLTFRSKGQDETTRNFIAFTGLRTLHLRDNFSIPDFALLRYAGLFTVPNSASSITTLLSDFLKTSVQIRQFEGEWLQIEESDRNRIGYQRTNNRLGHSFTIGRRIFSRQHRFRIVIGPVGYSQFMALQPGTKTYEQVISLVRLRAGEAMKFDCAVKVDKKSIPVSGLGSKSTQLGRTFFCISHKTQGPISSPIFKCESTFATALNPQTEETEGTVTEGRIHDV